MPRRRHLLSVVYRDAKPSVSLDHKRITLTVRPGSDARKRAEVIHDWHKTLLHDAVPGLIRKWESRLKVNVAGYFLQRMKTKWGSCNHRRAHIRLSGSRPLTLREERALVRRIRRTNPRDRALITCQLFSGFRISEVLSLTVGHVLHRGVLRDKMGLPPRFLKGHYGHTRWVPICPELARALENYLSQRARDEELTPDAPLFLTLKLFAPAVASRVASLAFPRKP